MAEDTQAGVMLTEGYEIALSRLSHRFAHYYAAGEKQLGEGTFMDFVLRVDQHDSDQDILAKTVIENPSIADIADTFAEVLLFLVV